MNRQRIKQLFLELANSIIDLYSSGYPPNPPSGPITSAFLVRGNLWLNGDPASAYFSKVSEAAALASKDPAWSKASIDDLFARHLTLVLSATDKLGCARIEADSLFEELGVSAVPFTRRVSIFGLEAEFGEMLFGELRISQGEYTAVANLPPFMEADTTSAYTFAEVTVTAIDEQTAALRANDVIDRHLAVLNALWSPEPASMFFLTRSYGSFIEFQIVSAQNASGEWGIGVASSRNRLLISRSDADRHHLGRAGNEVSTLLQREDTYAKRVIAGLELAGNACVERAPHTAFLLFAIALESAVLGRETREELTHQLALRTAHLLSTTMTGRKDVFRRVKKIYKTRSSIVHTGSRNVVETEVQEIRQLCLVALLTLASSEYSGQFQDTSQLDEWFQEKMLESPDNS